MPRARTRAVLAASLAIVCLAALLHLSTGPAGASGLCSITPTGGLAVRTIGARTYHLYVPPGLPGNGDGVPLLLSLHGLASSGVGTAGTVPWIAHAQEEGYIVAFPDGEGGAWRLAEGSQDVTFLRSVVTDIERSYCIDGSRVHATGHSLGGYMAQRLACDAADVFASVAGYASGSPVLTSASGGCSPQRAISVALFHGSEDGIVALTAGTGSVVEWVTRLGCPLAPSIEELSDGLVSTYRGCIDDTVVTWRQYDGQGHLWPTGAAGEDVRDRMWTHFTSNPHPTR